MALSSHFPLPKTLHSSKQFPFFVLLLSNGVTENRSTETNHQKAEFVAPRFGLQFSFFKENLSRCQFILFYFFADPPKILQIFVLSLVEKKGFFVQLFFSII